MQENFSRKPAPSQIQIAFTDKPITPYGGLTFLARWEEKLKLPQLLQQALPDHRTSPNALPVVDLARSLLASVAIGASRFAHVTRLRLDPALSVLLGLARIPSPSTLTRYFNSFTQAQVERLAQTLGSWLLPRLPHPERIRTLDLDSSVFVRYGKQQGAKKGYNPKKPGRPSHRPILAILAEAKIIANLWLRSGDTADLTGADQFLDETLAKLPAPLRIQIVRADTGFHDQKFFAYLEHRGLAYVVAVRMDRRIQRTISAAKGWQAIDEHRQITELSYQALTWDRPRRMVVVRERVRPGKENRGKKLFDLPDYTYSAVFTTLDWPALEVWRFYNHRADVENRIKELKEDFGIEGFCLHSFFGTEAVLRLIAFFYNLFTLFRVHILGNSHPTLKTVRHQLLVIGAQLGASGRRFLLRLAATGRLRNYLKILLERLSAFDESQLRCSWVGT